MSPLLCKNLIKLDRFLKFDKWPGHFLFFFVLNFANLSNGSVEKCVFTAKMYGQLAKQHRFGKKIQETDPFCNNLTVLEYDELF